MDEPHPEISTARQRPTPGNASLGRYIFPLSHPSRARSVNMHAGEIKHVSRDFRCSSQQPHTKYLSGIPAYIYFLWPGPRLGLGSRLWQCELPIAGHGLPIRFCQTLFRPLLVLDRFLGSCSPSYPAGSNSPASRPSILPNNRFVRYPSASISQ